VKTITNTSTNTAFEKYANANTNTFVTILFTVYHIQQRSFFPQSPINKFNRNIVVKKMAKSL